MSMQVTPGFGAFVATREKGNAHHQSVIVHNDCIRTHVIPTVSDAPYQTGQIIGSEMIFNNATRFSNDTAQLLSVQIALSNNTNPGNLQLVLYRDLLLNQPLDGGALTVEAAELSSILEIIQIKIEDFVSLTGNHIAMIKLPNNSIMHSGMGANSVRGVLIAGEGGFIPLASNVVTVVLSLKRD